MKATLEFDLPTEQAEFDAALEGHKWKQIAETMRMYFRERLKNGAHTEDGRICAQIISEKFYTLVDEAGLSFD